VLRVHHLVMTMIEPLRFSVDQFDAAGLASRLSYNDMLVLAQAFKRWAVEEAKAHAEGSLGLRSWSESLQRLSKAVGPGLVARKVRLSPLPC
jgi:hypothetical protein